jgi:hypothetical protein
MEFVAMVTCQQVMLGMGHTDKPLPSLSSLESRAYSPSTYCMGTPRFGLTHDARWLTRAVTGVSSPVLSKVLPLPILKMGLQVYLCSSFLSVPLLIA